MNKYLATFTIPVETMLNPEQLDEARGLINEHYTGSPTVPYGHTKNSLSAEHFEAVHSIARTFSGTIRVGLLPSGRFETIPD